MLYYDSLPLLLHYGPTPRQVPATFSSAPLVAHWAVPSVDPNGSAQITLESGTSWP